MKYLTLGLHEDAAGKEAESRGERGGKLANRKILEMLEGWVMNRTKTRTSDFFLREVSCEVSEGWPWQVAAAGGSW